MAQIVRRRNTARHTLLQKFIVVLLALLVVIGIFWGHQRTNLEGPAVSLLTLEDIRVEEVLDHPEVLLYQRKCSTERPTLQDVAHCYPQAPLQPFLDKSCSLKNPTTHLSWDFMQRCMVGRRNYPRKEFIPVHQFQIHVIGERNSGTKWLQQELAQCFPREQLGVRCHRDFLRSKHFFQPPARGMYETNLVIAIVRDPIEWVAAMREKPYHMPYHMAGFSDTATASSNKKKRKMAVIPLEWSEFVKRASPWTQPGLSAHDKQVIQSGTQKQVSCVQTFAFDEVTPCQFDNTTIPRSKWRGHMPIYELRRDHSGLPFADLLKLRSDKIVNFFLEIPLLMQLGGFAAVRYEDLLRQGTRPFLEQVAAMMGLDALPASCKPQAPHPERIGHRSIPAEFQQWIEDHLVLDTEQMLGYR